MNTNKKIADAKYSKSEKGKIARAKAWKKYASKPEVKKRRLEQKRKSYKKRVKYLNEYSCLYKTCTNCNVEKDWLSFRKRTRKSGKYLNSECMECERLNTRKYFKNNKEIIYKKRKQKLENDPLFKLRICIGKRTNEIFRKRKLRKNKRFIDYIGCTVEQLFSHIEKQFKEGMTWDNYGKWEIDHIIPLNSVKTEDDIYKLSHYTNLQPLWKFDNRSKGDKLNWEKF